MLKAPRDLQAMRRTVSLVPGVFGPRGKRSISSAQKQARNELLKKVYARFNKLDSGTQEYNELAISGKVWEDYFQPSDTGPYMAVQKALQGDLKEADEWKQLMKPKIPDLAKTLIAEYAHQSVSIENNPLGLGETQRVLDLLTEKVFKSTPLASMSTQDLANLVLPHFDKDPDNSQMNELKNHILASQWIAETAAACPGTPGLNEDDIRHLAARAVKGTDAENVYAYSWGGRVPLGSYRRTPISVASNPLLIFPYHIEVPACLKRFFQWRDLEHAKAEVHPLVQACHMTAYFVHIHPFPDGNGRVSRMLMHDYMVRQGFLPVVFQNLKRSEYLRMISDAQDHKPEEFVRTVVTTQLEELRTFYFRELAGSMKGKI